MIHQLRRKNMLKSEEYLEGLKTILVRDQTFEEDEANVADIEVNTEAGWCKYKKGVVIGRCYEDSKDITVTFINLIEKEKHEIAEILFKQLYDEPSYEELDRKCTELQIELDELKDSYEALKENERFKALI
jgi:hypothetical protein